MLNQESNGNAEAIESNEPVNRSAHGPVFVPSSDFKLQVVAGNVKKAMSESGAKSRDLWQVPYESLRIINGYNIRIRTPNYLEHLNGIASSMVNEGYRQSEPMQGYVANEEGQQVIYVTDGQTRHEAVGIAKSKGAEIDLIPVVLVPSGTTPEQLTVGLKKSNDGRPLIPFEVGILCKRLVGFGWDTDRIAKELSLGKQSVEGLLMLVGAPQEIRDMVINGDISATMAIQCLREKGSGAVAVLQKGLETAKSAGKKRVAPKHLPGATFAKEVKRQAPAFYSALKEIQSDPSYEGLAEPVRQKLDDLLEKIQELEEKAAAAESGKAEAVAAKTGKGEPKAGKKASKSGKAPAGNSASL